MKNILSKPHLFFFSLIPAIVIIGYFYKEKHIEIDISYMQHQISYQNISYFFAVFFGLIGLNYFSLYWSKKKPIKWMTGAHILFQMLALVLFFTKDNWNWMHKKTLPLEMHLNTDSANFIVVLSICIFIFSAFLHLMNFFVSLISKTK